MTRPHHIRPLIDAAALSDRVAQLGRNISREYAGRTPLVLSVLKGAALFTADLVRQVDRPLQLEFIKLSSYGSSTESSGAVALSADPAVDVRGRDVLVVEDIVDTGLSMQRLLSHLNGQQPSSIRVCTLLHKPARQRVAVPLDWVGFTIEDLFVVGYGLDYAEQYRQLPYIGVLEFTN